MITTVTVSTPWSMLDSAEDTLTQRTYEDEFNYFIHPHSYDNASSPARKRQRIVPDTALATGNGKTSAEPYTQDAIRLIVCRHVTEAVRNVKFRRLQVDNLAVQVCRDTLISFHRDCHTNIYLHRLLESWYQANRFVRRLPHLMAISTMDFGSK